MSDVFATFPKSFGKSLKLTFNFKASYAPAIEDQSFIARPCLFPQWQRGRIATILNSPFLSGKNIYVQGCHRKERGMKNKEKKR